MKRIIKVLSLILSLILCVSVFTGCYEDEFKYLYEKMDEFQIECNQYYIEACEPKDSTIKPLAGANGKYLFNSEEIIFEYDIDGYNVEFNDKKVHINDDYIKKHSETYLNIHKLWTGWDSKSDIKEVIGASKVSYIEIFDNEIFVVTDGWIVQLANRAAYSYPIQLYKYNLFEETFEYCGYLKTKDTTVNFVIRNT